MHPHRNTRRQRSWSRDRRLEALEEMLAPVPPEPETFWSLLRWAHTVGGEVGQRALDISGPYADAANELARVYGEACAAGEIILGERFPRALTGEVRFSDEHRARWDAATETMDAMTEQLRELKREELARRHAQQEGQ